MDEINVDVIVSNGTNVEVSSPSTLVNAHVNLPPPIESTTDSPSIDYRTHVILPGPQGPAGPIGPVGPQGLQGNISGINDLNAPVIYLSGQDGITVYSGSYNTLCISGNSGYFQDQINLLTLNLFNTGNNLYLLQYNYSGWANNQFATNANLLITGNLLQGQINTLATSFASTGSGLQTQINTLTTNLFTTGSTLATNLALTGSSLQTQVNTLTTNLFTTGSTLATNLALTGSSLQTQVNTLTTNLFTTGSTLATGIANYSGWATNIYATISNLNLTGSSLALQIYNTGSILDSKINSLSGVSVLTFGNQNIYGNKNFYDTVFINNLTVTGTETIVSTQNFNVQSPYILLNLTGGAVDGGIFFVTGSGLTGINDPGPIIGFDHSDNFVFGISTRASDLSTLNKIASKQDISNYSGFASSTYATIINLNITGSSLQNQINTILSNQQIFTTSLTPGLDAYQINYPVSFSSIPKIQATLEVPGNILYSLSISNINMTGYTGLLSDDLTEVGAKIHTFASIQ
jgi:hypothetical protein